MSERMKCKYSRPDEEYYIVHFAPGKERIRKNLRQVHLYPKDRKIFVPVRLLGAQALLCAMIDGVPMYYSKKNPEVFVDSQWVLDENIGGKETLECLPGIIEKLWKDHDEYLLKQQKENI